jgi:hypothetical protein
MGGAANFRRRHSAGTVYRTVSSACGTGHRPASAYYVLIVYVKAFSVEEKWKSGHARVCIRVFISEGHP